MKPHWILAFIVLAPLCARAADQPDTEPSTQPDDSGLTIAFTGDPSGAGQVTTRLEAEGGRCVSDPTIMAFAWCTPTTGLTTAAHPELVWYLNKSLPLKVMVILTNPATHTTYHLWQSSGSVPAGIHLLDTSASDVSLQVGVEYKWTVRIVNDQTDPSKDTYSSGAIRRVDASDPIAANHCFYDAMGNAVETLSNATQSGDTAKITAIERAINQLVGMAQLDAVDQFAVTTDRATH
jgi:hypothetical protein